ncbi:MAG TPA: cupin domain-containing protein [Rhizomicrobium sp.]|jgi:quercetin dioxygenase-like cupin family protein|nr:cupin domain-containing protein [Rhizomicrobium sp.]
MIRTKILGAALAAFATTAYAADVPAPKVDIQKLGTLTTTVTGQPIVVPSNPDVIASIGTFPPGSRLPEHKHPYPHIVYVMEGTLTVTNTETGKTFEVHQGDFVAEMEDTWHYGVNNGTVPVKLFVIDEVPHGTTSNLVPKTP